MHESGRHIDYNPQMTEKQIISFYSAFFLFYSSINLPIITDNLCNSSRNYLIVLCSSILSQHDQTNHCTQNNIRIVRTVSLYFERKTKNVNNNNGIECGPRVESYLAKQFHQSTRASIRRTHTHSQARLLLWRMKTQNDI